MSNNRSNVYQQSCHTGMHHPSYTDNTPSYQTHIRTDIRYGMNSQHTPRVKVGGDCLQAAVDKCYKATGNAVACAHNASYVYHHRSNPNVNPEGVSYVSGKSVAIKQNMCGRCINKMTIRPPRKCL